MDKDKNLNEDDFMKQNPILFKKFKIKNKLAEGAFGDVYIGSTLDTNDLVAIKVEQKKIPKPLLESEAYFLLTLKGLGIPEVLSFGRRKDYNILVEPLLGKSLFDIFNERRKHMAIGDICLIAKQILDRIQWVHSKGFVHRDIKPDNFLIGRKDPNVIYLIDFGLSKKYKSDKTGKHLKFGFTGKLTGTVRFASANALRGGEQSRRDDLESIAYMIIFFMRGKLPWQGVTGTKKMERYLKIYKMKKNVTPEDLCKSLPSQMVSFVKYVKQLEFEQEPDYNYLRSLFQSILKQRKMNFDSFVFSWIKISDIKKLKDPINPATRKESPQGRLLKKIESKLKSERNNSSDNDSGHRSYQTADALTQDKEINYTSKDEAEVEDKNYKSKKEKSKEGLNTLVANLNQSLEENLNFEDTEKKEKNQIKKKNYTVNDTLDYKTEIKIQNYEKALSNKNKENQRDKSEEIRLSNCNERKMSLMVIDENEEKNKNENIENNLEKKDDKKNEIKKEKEKETNEKKIIDLDKNKANIDKKIKNKDEIQKFNQKQNIIPIKRGKINNDSININNINLIKKNIDSESPEKINNINANRNNIIQIKKENDINNQNKIKTENQVENNIQNIIKMPNKDIQKNNGKNLDISNKIMKGKKYNKNNIIIKKGIDLNMDKANIQIKNQQKNQKVNIKTKKIKIDKRPNKLMIENEEGPMDNKRNNYIRMNDRMAFNTEIANYDVGFNSSKNVEAFINTIKIKNKNNNHERRHTPNNLYNMKNIKDNYNQKYKNNISAFNNDKNLDLDLLPQNSDEMIDDFSNKFNKDKIVFNDNTKMKFSNLSSSANLNQDNDFIYNKINNNNINNNNKSNITFNSKKKRHNKSNERLKNDNDNNNLINNFMQPKNNDNKNLYDKINNINNENLKNYEFNANRKIRIVNRNKNQNKTNNLNNNPNSKNIQVYNTFSDNTGYKKPKNNIYEAHNININNHINNNIIINNNISNKYAQPKNSSFRSNSNNPYSGQNIIDQNLILSKRPSHNINSNKVMRSFKIYMDPNQNLNSIQYMKRPSFNIKNNNMNNNNISNNNNNNNNININPMNHIIVNKRPSYNTNFNVSNFLNNTEPNKSHILSTKIKKLPNKNNMSGHIQVKGKYTEIIEDNRATNYNGLTTDYVQEQYNPNLNKTYNNNIMINKINLKNNFNNNNIMIYKENNLNNYSKMMNVNYPPNQYVGNTNKIKIEKIPNYKNNYQSKIGNYQNVNNQFDNNAQYYGFSNY